MNIIDRILPFIARFCLVVLFPFSALDKIFDYGNAVAQANTSGLPVPGWLLLLANGLLEVFGSLGILFNVYARQFALPAFAHSQSPCTDQQIYDGLKPARLSQRKERRAFPCDVP